MRPNLDDPQGYQVRLKPLYGEMFRAAYAIIGNRDLAEFVLKMRFGRPISGAGNGVTG